MVKVFDAISKLTWLTLVKLIEMCMMGGITQRKNEIVNPAIIMCLFLTTSNWFPKDATDYPKHLFDFCFAHCKC